MSPRFRLPYALFSVLIVLTGCASTPSVAPPEVPANLRPPADQVVFLETLATGAQLYECTRSAGPPSTFDWVFRSPEATLVDRSGITRGRHFAGPTWESLDGSSVVGDVKARDPGPNPSSIPWLMLTAKSTSGTGVFSATRTIQRVNTVGGLAPTGPCAAANVGEIARVPYTATYYFYRTKS